MRWIQSIQYYHDLSERTILQFYKPQACAIFRVKCTESPIRGWIDLLKEHGISGNTIENQTTFVVDNAKFVWHSEQTAQWSLQNKQSPIHNIGMPAVVAVETDDGDFGGAWLLNPNKPPLPIESLERMARIIPIDGTLYATHPPSTLLQSIQLIHKTRLQIVETQYAHRSIDSIGFEMPSSQLHTEGDYDRWFNTANLLLSTTCDWVIHNNRAIPLHDPSILSVMWHKKDPSKNMMVVVEKGELYIIANNSSPTHITAVEFEQLPLKDKLILSRRLWRVLAKTTPPQPDHS